MSKRVSTYTQDQKNEAAILYASYGVMSKVSKALDIPKTTLSMWKREGEWWDDVVANVRTEKAQEHIAQYSKLTDKALAAAERGIDELNGKTLSAGDIKSLVVSGATCTDKARLISNQPTSIHAKTSDSDGILSFLRQASKDYHKALNTNVIEHDKGPTNDDGGGQS